MSLANVSQEELKLKSMLELASLILKDAQKALDFREIFDKVAEMKGFTKEEKEEKIAQFYTELNVDGRFLTLGENIWGLRSWYPFEKADENVTSVPKKKKSQSKKKDDLDEELEYEEDLVELGEEEEEELEDIEGFDAEYDGEELDEEEVLDVDVDLEDEEEKM